MRLPDVCGLGLVLFSLHVHAQSTALVGDASDVAVEETVARAVISSSAENGTTLGGNTSNSSFPNGTTPFPSNSALLNTTIPNSTTSVPSPFSVPYNGTLSSLAADPNDLPFEIRIWAGYAIVGVVLIASGGFVGLLGGRHRWSSMAIVSGYSLMLFTLIMILRFGVLPSLAPPSPTYPSSTTIGLYSLALLISSLIGSAIGLFWWNATKFWVPAVGGWAVGWWIMAFKSGGVTDGQVLGRWGLIGGCTVLAFILGHIPSVHPHALLLSTAMIGSTAFVLGIDCFARAGLKEFYVYNLGFSGLFPKLNGYDYPLLVDMEVELGVIAACFLVGAAIQYRVLGLLHIRLKQIQTEDKARRDAEESKRAAQRFTHVQDDLDQWEEKHGKDAAQKQRGGLGSSQNLLASGNELEGLPTLATGHGGERGDESTRSHSGSMRPTVEGYYHRDELPRHSPSLDEHDFIASLGPRSMSTGARTVSTSRQSAGPLPTMEFGDKLAPALGVETLVDDNDPAEVERRKLLAEIAETRKSIEQLRSATPTSMIHLTEEGSGGRRLSSRSMARGNRPSHCEPPHSAGLNGTDATQNPNDWDQYLLDRKLFTPPAGISPPIQASPREFSFGRLARVSSSVLVAVEKRERTRSAYELGSMAEFGGLDTIAPETDRRSFSFEPLSIPGLLSPTVEWRSSTLPTQYPALPPATIARAHSSYLLSGDNPAMSQAHSQEVRRELTYVDLNERHRAKLGRMQRPITEQMHERIALAEAKAHYDQARGKERTAREAKDGAQHPVTSSAGGESVTAQQPRNPTARRTKSCDRLNESFRHANPMVIEWRKSAAQPVADHAAKKACSTIPIPFPSPNKKANRHSRGPNEHVN